MVYGQKDELVFLGKEIGEQRDYSEAVAEKIDIEVQKLVSQAYKQAKDILTKYRTKLDEISNRLLESETLSRDEFEKLFPLPMVKKGGIPSIVEK